MDFSTCWALCRKLQPRYLTLLIVEEPVRGSIFDLRAYRDVVFRGTRSEFPVAVRTGD